MSEAASPYAAPTARVDDAAPTEAEATRRAHLSHEAGIKSLGMLYYLGAAALSLGGIAAAVGGAGAVEVMVTLLLVVGIGALQGWVGYGLRHYRSWARIPAVVLLVLGLLGFPIGTLISAYGLWLVLSAKGRIVLSPEYAAVVAATPHIRYRTSVVVWVVVVLLVIFIAMAVFGIAMNKAGL